MIHSERRELRDRELFAYLIRVYTNLSEVVLDLTDGQLPAADVRELGQHVTKLGVDLLARAKELDGGPVDHVIIDARPLDLWVADKSTPATEDEQ